jgi:hypothetical protein
MSLRVFCVFIQETSTMLYPVTTREAAKLLGIRSYTLHHLVLQEYVPAPRKFNAGFAWFEADIERAKKFLENRKPHGRRPARELASMS